MNIATYDIETINVNSNMKRVPDIINCIGICFQRGKIPLNLVCITTANVSKSPYRLTPCADPIKGSMGIGYDWKFDDLRGFFRAKDVCKNDKSLTQEDAFLVSHRNVEENEINEDLHTHNCTPVRHDDANLCQAQKYFEDMEMKNRWNGDNVFPATRIVRCNTEYDLLKAFFAEIIENDTHVLVGFNNLGFDMKFILRASNYYGLDGIDELSVHIHSNVRVFQCDLLRNKIRKLDPNRRGGLIKSGDLDLSSNHSTGIFETDIYPQHRTTLNKCAHEILKLDTAKLQIGYDNIPVLFYNDPALLIYYCVRDLLLTNSILNECDQFNCIDYNYMLEELAGTAVYQNFTGMKSLQTSAESYKLFNDRNMVQEAIINPKIKNFYLTFCDIIDHFLAQNPRDHSTYTGLSLSIINSLQCGLWETKPLRKWLDEYYLEHKTQNKNTLQQRAEKILDHICKAIRGGTKGSKAFNSQTLMFFVDHVARDKLSIRRPMNTYAKLIPEILETVTEKTEDATFDELNDFVYFLCTLDITEFDDLVTEIVPLYKKHRGSLTASWGKPPTSVVITLAHMLSGNMSVLNMIRDEFLSLNPGQKCTDSETLAKNLWNKLQFTGVTVELKKSKYDGAHLIEPAVGLYNKNSVGVVDMSGFYPGCLIETNTGITSEISFENVMNLLESGKITEGLDFVCINVRRIDDGVDWKRYVKNYPEYVKNNFVFMLSANMCKSVYARKVEIGIARRNVHKYKSQDKTLSERGRSEHLIRSNTLKIKNNAEYGLFKTNTKSNSLSAVVTSRSRTCLKRTIQWITDNFDIKEVYGDTDSIMSTFGKSDEELVNFVNNGSAAAVERCFRTDILGLTQTKLREICYIPFEAGKDMRYVGANLVAVINKSICEHLNTTLVTYKKPNSLDFEKVCIPFHLHTKKNYIGWQPLEGCYIIKGNSRTLPRATTDINSKIMECARDNHLEDLYPYLVEKLVNPCINGTIDMSWICRHSTVNVEMTNLKMNWIKVVNYLKSSGKPILFPKQHFDYVHVVHNNEHFYATVEQFEKEMNKPNSEFQLDVTETLTQILSVPLKRLSVMYDETTFSYFQNLQIPILSVNPAVNWSKLRTPAKMKVPPIKISKTMKNRLLNPQQTQTNRRAGCNSKKCGSQVVKRIRQTQNKSSETQTGTMSYKRKTVASMNSIIKTNKKVTDFYRPSLSQSSNNEKEHGSIEFSLVPESLSFQPQVTDTRNERGRVESEYRVCRSQETSHTITKPRKRKPVTSIKSIIRTNKKVTDFYHSPLSQGSDVNGSKLRRVESETRLSNQTDNGIESGRVPSVSILNNKRTHKDLNQTQLSKFFPVYRFKQETNSETPEIKYKQSQLTNFYPNN